MPRVLRKSKRRTVGYNECHVMHLLEGVHVLDGFGHGDEFDAEAAKVAWDLMRDKLLADWIRDRPGTRPAAWWLFDAPEPKRRERCDGGVHPFDNRDRALQVAKYDSLWKAAYRPMFGLPTAFIMPFDQGLTVESYEPQWSFLVRHNLLVPEDSP